MCVSNYLTIRQLRPPATKSTRNNNNKRNVGITDRWIRVPYTNEDSFKEIISAAASANCQLYEMERVPVTMDNIYLEVVN